MRTVFKNEGEINSAGDRLYNGYPQRDLNPNGAKWPWRFTGWKYCGYHYHTDDPVEMDSAFIAQWVYRVPAEGVAYYVNLPGMQSGKVMEGGLFDIGTERVEADTPKEEIIRLVDEGKQKLIELLKANGIDPAPHQ